ncbi:molybdenum cofactor biosynthesis protein MoaE [Thermodesulfovibrio thiophilus]|uniref:molybdenum cofactor biosynthesis protein MoaE n=1 Tax=Thermodesulfovibrio thiophilus TaxID=340095 RepID=UPI0017F286A7|nr:molybdenum cofactor biosynthesis protein MoaE [Thermodesulfovibrio thiophilus]HHW19550.1 molybdenum cofactor biosynthesis protein MoaE [Thermodesulfovibrio thiophilus]
MIDKWITEIKQHPQIDKIGMILIHNGIVRATSKNGRSVKEMYLSYDAQRLGDIVQKIQKREGIYEVRVWINKGRLKIGDDIMKVLVAGRFRTEVLPALEELVKRIKNEVVHEEEII